MRAPLLGLLLATGCVQALPGAMTPRLRHEASAVLVIAERDTSAQPAETGKISLVEAYRLALAINENVGLAERNLHAAEIASSGKLTEMEPAIAVTGTAVEQTELASGGVVFKPGEQVNAAAAIAQPIFRRDFFAERRAADRGIRSARASYERARQQLARDLVGVYVDVLRNRKLLELATDAVDRAKTQQQLAVARVRAGQALRNAELLATVDLTRAQRNEVIARRDSANAEIAFQRLVGRAPPKELEVPALPDVPDTHDALQLAIHRPDVDALALALDQAEAEVDASAGRRLWPRLDASASVSYVTPQIFGTNVQWQVLGLVTIPIFQSGNEYVDLSLKENEAQSASLSLSLQRKIVVQEVQTAAQQLASTAQEAEFAAQQRDAARENYKLVDKQVRLGAITPLEVTNAQAVLTEAETAFEVATMDRTIAVYDYLFAIGVLDLTAPDAWKRKR